LAEVLIGTPVACGWYKASHVEYPTYLVQLLGNSECLPKGRQMAFSLGLCNAGRNQNIGKYIDHVRRTKHTIISRDLRKRYRYQSDLKPPCPHPNRSSCMRLKSSILRHRLYASRCSLVACAFGSLAARRGRRVRHRSKKSHLYMIPIPFPGTSTVSHVPKDRSSSRLVLLFAAEPNLRKLGSTSSKSRNALTAHRRRAGHTITRLSDTELA
jgi:hypothetical protein